MPLWAASMSPLATWINFESRDSTSSPTYPASVRLVASPMTRGTLRYEAGDLTRWVLPEPLEPISRMLDFSIVQVKVGDDRIGSVGCASAFAGTCEPRKRSMGEFQIL